MHLIPSFSYLLDFYKCKLRVDCAQAIICKMTLVSRFAFSCLMLLYFLLDKQNVVPFNRMQKIENETKKANFIQFSLLLLCYKMVLETLS